MQLQEMPQLVHVGGSLLHSDVIGCRISNMNVS